MFDPFINHHCYYRLSNIELFCEGATIIHFNVIIVSFYPSLLYIALLTSYLIRIRSPHSISIIHFHCVVDLTTSHKGVMFRWPFLIQSYCYSKSWKQNWTYIGDYDLTWCICQYGTNVSSSINKCIMRKYIPALKWIIIAPSQNNSMFDRRL